MPSDWPPKLISLVAANPLDRPPPETQVPKPRLALAVVPPMLTPEPADACADPGAACSDADVCADSDTGSAAVGADPDICADADVAAVGSDTDIGADAQTSEPGADADADILGVDGRRAEETRGRDRGAAADSTLTFA
jgi:hypothetical protein